MSGYVVDSTELRCLLIDSRRYKRQLVYIQCFGAWSTCISVSASGVGKIVSCTLSVFCHAISGYTKGTVVESSNAGKGVPIDEGSTSRSL